MPRLWPRPDTVHIGYLDGSLAPVLEVDDGAEVAIRTVSGDPGDPVPAEWMPPEIPEIFAARLVRGPGPHILTGPVGVRGAAPGALLQIDIQAIRLGAGYGYNQIKPLKGLFPEDFTDFARHIIPIDRAAGIAHLLPGIDVPTRPFFGIMAVAPDLKLGRLDSRVPWSFGGNIDNKELVAGSRLYLPIQVEGALFSVGDGHAAQGDGEVNQTAIETSLEGVFRLQVRRDFRLDLPFAVTPEHLISMAFHEDLDEAARRAVKAMIVVLGEHYGLAAVAAYRLCSAAADLRVTQVVNGNKGIHVMMARSLLAGLGRAPAITAGL